MSLLIIRTMFGLRFKLIPHAPDGQNMLRISGIFFHGLAEAIDMDRDGGRISQGVHAPDFRIEGFPAVNHVRMDHEEFKELEFLVRQFFFLTPHVNAMGIGFQGDARAHILSRYR